MFSNHNGIKLEIHNIKKFEKFTNMENQHEHTLPNDQRVQGKFTREI